MPTRPSTLGFLVFLAYFILASFLLRWAQIKLGDTPAGRALAAING